MNKDIVEIVGSVGFFSALFIALYFALRVFS